MKPTQELHELGRSLWLDNITGELLDSGTLKRYIDELSVTGLTSNPTIFERAITGGNSYDGAIRQLSGRELSEEELSFELALQEVTRAADLFCYESWCRSDKTRSMRLQAITTLKAGLSIVTWTLEFSSARALDKAYRSAPHSEHESEGVKSVSYSGEIPAQRCLQ